VLANFRPAALDSGRLPSEYVLPVGLHLDAPAAPELAEGYEVRWRDEDDPPHYFFYAQVSVLRVERLLTAALAVMPPRIHAVLELRRCDERMEEEPAGPAQDRFVSALVPRDEVAAVFERYRFQILHDGMAGFGFYDPASPLEVFLDDHKLLSLFAPGLEPFEGLLAGLGVPHRERLGTVLDLEHEHHGLVAVPDRTACKRHEWLRRRKYDVNWFGRTIRRRLRMRAEPQLSGGGLPDADAD
jgi:hypothetical protein